MVNPLTGLALDRVADQFAATTERAVEEVVARRSASIAAAAERMRRDGDGAPPRLLAERAVARRSRQVALTGAVSAAPALVPGAGTAVEVGAALADVALLTASEVELVLLEAALYGRGLDDREGRRLDVLLALGMEAGVVKLRRDGAVDILGEHHTREELGAAGIDRLAARVNRRLGRQVARRLARRHVKIIIGRELPAIGIGLAAGYNLRSTRRVGNAGIQLFEHLS